MTLFRNIKKNVIVLGVASFFTDISSEMLYPIVPIFLTTVLGAPVSIVGLIEGIAESTASVLKAFSGWLSDRLKRRRPFVVGGYSLSSFAKVVLFFAYIWPTVLIARFLDRLGKGLRTSPRDAMLADSSDSNYRGKVFGFHRAMDSLGACIGPLTAIWFLNCLSKEDLRIVFLIAFIPAALAVLTLIFFLKETQILEGTGMDKSGVDPDKPTTQGLKGTFSLGRDFKGFLIISAIFALGNSSDAFLILRSKELGLSMTMVIFAYVLYNISYSLSSTPFGVLSDKISRKKVLVVGYSIFALVYLGFALATQPKIVWPLFIVYGFYMAMTDGVGKAFVSDMVGSEYRATALGLYHFTLGLFAFFASVVAGLLWTHIGIKAPFLYGASTAMVACIALAISPRSRRVIMNEEKKIF